METATMNEVYVPESVDDDEELSLDEQVQFAAFKIDLLRIALTALLERVENLENDHGVDHDDPEPAYRSENTGGC